MKNNAQFQDIRLTDDMERRLLQQAVEGWQPFGLTAALRKAAARLSRAGAAYLRARAQASSNLQPGAHA